MTPSFSDSSSLPTIGPSAFIGQPPQTVRDYYIVNGLFRMVGLKDANPMAGYFFAARPPPDYVHESRRAGVQIGLVIVMLTIVIPTTIRLVLRARHKRMHFGSDDWAILAAALLALTYPIAQTTGLYISGAGFHMWEVTYEQYEIGTAIGTFCKITFYQAVSLIKISIALFIRRLASGTSRRWRWFCDIFLVSVGAYMLLALFWLVFTCDPIQAQWSLHARGVTEPIPHCLNTILQGRILSAIHVAQGMLLLSAPIFILWTVRMQRSKKIRLFLVWALGGLTVLGGLLRQVRPLVHRDMTWDYVEVLAFTCLDLALGLIAASLPVIDGMFSGVWHRAVAGKGSSPREAAIGDPAAGPHHEGPSREPTRNHSSSDSKRSIINRTDEMELGIIKTRVVRVESSSKSSFDEFDFGLHTRSACRAATLQQY